MTRSKKPKKKISSAARWMAVLLSAFLPVAVYAFFCALCPSRGGFGKPPEVESCNILVIGFIIAILVGAGSCLLYVRKYRRVRGTGSGLEQAALLFCITAVIIQLVCITGFSVDWYLESYSWVGDPMSWWEMSSSGMLRYVAGDRIHYLARSALFSALVAFVVSGVHYVILIGRDYRHRTKSYFGLLGQILIAASPMAIVVISHLVATLQGVPYNESCCFVVLPDPTEQTVSWFLAWEIGGTILALALSCVLGVVAMRRYARDRKTPKSAARLLCLGLLIGEILLLSCLAAAVLNPGMFQNDLYRHKYFQFGNIGASPLTAWLPRWAECVFFVYLVCPVATLVALVAAKLSK